MLPEEMAKMKMSFSIVEAALGDGIKQPAANEVASIIRFRKTMYSKHLIKKGSILGIDDIIYTGPAYGIYAKFESLVLGQAVNKDIPANTPITWDILKST